MKQTRAEKPRARREPPWREALPADPRDPDIVRAKALARAGRPGQQMTVSVLSRAVLARHRWAIAASVAGLLSIAGAAVSGASFADHGHRGASMAMAVLTAVALLCYLLNLFALGISPSTLRPATSATQTQRRAMCSHRPPCPPSDRPDRDAARTIAFHPEQGWSLLCNGVIVFDDTGELLPDGRAVPPHRPAVIRRPIAA